MQIHLHAMEFCPSKGQGLHIVDGRGHRIVCKSGCVWITQDGDTRDFVPVQNESLTLAKDNTVYISPIRYATFCVEVAKQRRTQFTLEVIRVALRAIFANPIRGRSADRGERL